VGRSARAVRRSSDDGEQGHVARLWSERSVTQWMQATYSCTVTSTSTALSLFFAACNRIQQPGRSPTSTVACLVVTLCPVAKSSCQGSCASARPRPHVLPGPGRSQGCWHGSLMDSSHLSGIQELACMGALGSLRLHFSPAVACSLVSLQGLRIKEVIYSYIIRVVTWLDRHAVVASVSNATRTIGTLSMGIRRHGAQSL
jgi:hypothetical protein